jgi:HEAT repeat protein
MRLAPILGLPLGGAALVRRLLVALLAMLLLAPGAARADKLFDALSAAVKDLGRPDASVEVRRAAVDTIAEAGSVLRVNPPAVLLPALEDTNESVRVKAARTMWQLGPTTAQHALDSRLINALQNGSLAVRMEVVAVLTQVGRLAPNIVLPALMRACQEDNSPEVRLRAAGALVRIYLGLGPEPESGPLEDLGNNHPVEQMAALVPVVRDACKALASALKDPDEQVRLKALKAIQEMGPTAAQVAIRELLRALEDKKPAVRAEAVSALGGAGRLWPGLIVPKVARALKDGDKQVRLRAAGILGGIGPVARSAVPDLIEALKANDVSDVVGLSVCRNAAWSLAAMGPAAKPAIPVIVEMLDSSDPRVRTDALKVLEGIGDSDERVAPALLKALKHKEKEVRVLAAVNLGQMGPKYAKEALPLLLKGLDVRDVKDQSFGGKADSRQYLIVRALAKMGPLAEEAVPKLREILDDPKREFVHPAAREALKKIQP